MPTLETLRDKLKRLRSLQEISLLLGWDHQTYLPPKGAAGRGEQMELISSLIHQSWIDPDLRELLQSLRDDDTLSSDDQVIVRESLRTAERAFQVPAKLVSEIARAESDGYSAWVMARKGNAFSEVAPILSRIIELKREYAQCIGGALDRYDALLDTYEPYARSSEVAVFFDAIEPTLQNLLNRIYESPRYREPLPEYHGVLSDSGITALFNKLLPQMGFDLEAGRFDRTVHPFCTDPGHEDVRLTYRVNHSDIAETLFPLMHEAGHGLYDQGFDSERFGTPLAEACSLGIHESQSLTWEKQIGRSRAFLNYLLPQLQHFFPEVFSGWTAEPLYRKINRVERTLIRVEADEVSYGLHVIIRFRLERALVLGDLTIADLPAAWNEAYQKTLGIKPPDELRGVLQDVHWYTGGVGYFPTYLLGAAYAAQLFQAFQSSRPEFTEELARGEMKPLREWLRLNIHRHGKRYTASELITNATGSPPTPSPYLQYLNKKYSELYDFPA